MSEFMHDCPVQMAFYAKMSFPDSNIRAIAPIEKTHFTDATMSGDEPWVDITLSKDIEGGKNYIIAPTGKDPFVLNASSSANTDSVLNTVSQLLNTNADETQDLQEISLDMEDAQHDEVLSGGSDAHVASDIRELTERTQALSPVGRTSTPVNTEDNALDNTQESVNCNGWRSLPITQDLVDGITLT